jgi:hypothetical protein
VAFIIGANLRRRHLSMGQKVALAVEIEPSFAKEAKQRKLSTLKKGKNSDVENVPQREQSRSRDQAAAAVGLSGKTVTQAKAIKVASPERFEKIKQGKLTVAKARKEIKAEQDRERKMGQMLKEAAEDRSRQTRGGNRKSNLPADSLKPSLSDLGLSDKESAEAQRVAEMANEE